jgi:hypothetical protein
MIQSEQALATASRRNRVRALIDALDNRCLAVQYPAHGSLLRRFNRCGTVNSDHRAGPRLRSRHSSGIDTIAPGLARGEKAETDVFVRLFRMKSIRIFLSRPALANLVV